MKCSFVLRTEALFAPERNMPKFKTTLLQAKGMNATGIVIPPPIVEGLGGGKKPPVKVTINGYTYRNTVAVMGGKFMVGVAVEHREKAGLKGGDKVEVTLELDTAPRKVGGPKDLAAALKKANAREAFDKLAYSYRKVQPEIHLRGSAIPAARSGHGL
jgi:hypothetical protein